MPGQLEDHSSGEFILSVVYFLFFCFPFFFARREGSGEGGRKGYPFSQMKLPHSSSQRTITSSLFLISLLPATPRPLLPPPSFFPNSLLYFVLLRGIGYYYVLESDGVEGHCSWIRCLVPLPFPIQSAVFFICWWFPSFLIRILLFSFEIYCAFCFHFALTWIKRGRRQRKGRGVSWQFRMNSWNLSPQS